MSETTEKVWVRGPAGAEVCLLIPSEIERSELDKRIARGELTIIEDPSKPAKPAKVAKAAAKKSESDL